MPINHIIYLQNEKGEWVPTLPMNDLKIAQIITKAIRLDGVIGYNKVLLKAADGREI